MTQEDKQLLLIDFCARLPYKIKVKVSEVSYPVEFDIQMLAEIKNNTWYEYPIPYLRRMSSMTYEEKTEFKEIRNSVEAKFINAINGDGFTLAYYELTDWLNKHYFDYRGLIFMGLALEAKEGMYNVK